jgi:hypothetical protein
MHLLEVVLELLRPMATEVCLAKAGADQVDDDPGAGEGDEGRQVAEGEHFKELGSGVPRYVSRCLSV